MLETIAAVGSHSLCCNISTSGEEWCLERSARLLMGLRALFMARRHGDPLHKAREGLIDQLDGGGVLFPFPRVRLLVWALLSVDMAGSEGCAPRVIRDVFSDQNMWCQHETVFANLFYFRNVTHCRVKQDIWWETIVIWDCFTCVKKVNRDIFVFMLNEKPNWRLFSKISYSFMYWNVSK